MNIINLRGIIILLLERYNLMYVNGGGTRVPNDSRGIRPSSELLISLLIRISSMSSRIVVGKIVAFPLINCHYQHL